MQLKVSIIWHPLCVFCVGLEIVLAFRLVTGYTSNKRRLSSYFRSSNDKHGAVSSLQ